MSVALHAVMDRIIDRLRVDENGCWIYTGARTKGGYGHLYANREHISCHRFTYEYFRGAIPTGLQTDHLCRNRACANPWHLEIVTNRENTLRGNHPNVRLRRAGVCKHGHEFTPDNCYERKNGTVTCRKCRDIRQDAWNEKRRNLRDGQRIIRR